MPELCCGKCGYNVRGLPSSICPECGSDLDVVGRVPADRGRGRRVARAILLAVLLALSSTAISVVTYYTLIPLQVDRNARVWLFGPESTAFVDIRMDFHSIRWRFPGWAIEGGDWQNCRVKLQRLDGSSDEIVVDLSNRTFRTTRADGRAVGPELPVAVETLAEWLNRNSLDTEVDADAIRMEAATIAGVLDDAIVCGPLFQWSRATRLASARTSFSWSRSPSGPKTLKLIPGSSFLAASFWRRGSARWLDASKWLMVGMGILIWIGGLCFLLRRRRLAYARS